jgi:hypothetical protein
MKKFIVILSLFLGGFVLTAKAQDDANERSTRQQKIEALYIAFMTKELNLTETEAQKFWPVHKEYDNEVKGVNMEMPELQRQQAVLDIKKKYQERFVKILGNTRTDDFFRKDMEFRKQLVERLRNMREQRKANGQRPRGNQ